MRNHDQKFRDISRSVLPSTRRKGARDDLRNIKQKARRVVNRQLARIDSIDTYFEDSGIEDLLFYPNADIGYAVQDRRNGDKLSVIHWAEERTRKEGITDPHERYAFVKRALPDNIIGRHALSHAASAKGFCDGFGGFRSDCELHPYVYARSRRNTRHSQANLGREELVAFFADLITQPGMHLALNREIKRQHKPSHYEPVPGSRHWDAFGRAAYAYAYVYCAGCRRPRVLAGLHDVEAWVADVFFPYNKDIRIFSWWRQGFGVEEYRKTPYHQEWRDAASKFLLDAVVAS